MTMTNQNVFQPWLDLCLLPDDLSGGGDRPSTRGGDDAASARLRREARLHFEAHSKTLATMSYPPNASNMPTPGGPSSAMPPPGGPPGGGPPGSYFTETRKGEVNELRQLLRTFATERDKQRKRDIMKKVIAYMTLGIDVSRLFTEMMLAIETRDLVIKKMVYLFLCNYA